MRPTRREKLTKILVYWLIFIFLIGLIPMVLFSR